MPQPLAAVSDASDPATAYEPAPEPVVDPITHSPLHAAMNVGGYYGTLVIGAIFPATMGVILYGWRAMAAIAIVVGSALFAGLLWQRIGARGQQLRLIHVGWWSLLLALMLPAHLASRGDLLGYGAPLVILIASGMTLVILMWTLGGLGAGRVHPVLVCYLLLCVLYSPALVPHRILQRGHVGTGELFSAPAPDLLPSSSEPWIKAAPPGQGQALYRPSSAVVLSHFTTGVEANDPHLWLNVDGLLRDRMPPLEDFIVGGEPGPIGAGCALGVIVGGLFLLYRGLIDYRIPLIIFAVAYAAMVVLPIPVVVTHESHYHWMAMRLPEVNWQTALTFVHYELLAGPMLFMAFFLATAPSIRPASKWARALYATIAGLLTAVFQLYVSVSYGPYLALLIASLLTPTFDKLLRPRPLV
jgi:Na+-translocating ferredoxin:NAD+ oxidoreductase RnfD subunit